MCLLRHSSLPDVENLYRSLQWLPIGGCSEYNVLFTMHLMFPHGYVPCPQSADICKSTSQYYGGTYSSSIKKASFLQKELECPQDQVQRTSSKLSLVTYRIIHTHSEMYCVHIVLTSRMTKTSLIKDKDSGPVWRKISGLHYIQDLRALRHTTLWTHQ